MGIPLNRAWLCIECNHIVESQAGGKCPDCGSRAQVNVERVMNRQIAAKIAPQVLPTEIEQFFAAEANLDRRFLRGLGIEA